MSVSVKKDKKVLYDCNKVHFMKSGFIFFWLLVFSVLLPPIHVKSQSCNSCTVSILTNDSLTFRIINSDTTSYTVNVGQTLCIYATGTLKGNITLNGGIICNNGRFFPNTLAFNSGTLSLVGITKIKNPVTVSGNKAINVSQGCVMNITGNLSLTGGTLNNEGMINVDGALINNSGDLVNKAIINCSTMSGNNAVNNNGIGIINTKN